ncbi:hypothetical protein ABZ863_01600 [Saccharomonospora sp. NPDC046836]|uniref:hypothetical protein n=1 Tax=Saccharomonospora sp. NPDC046836 TaxID=3156921 RepID=UPI0033FF19B1
MYRRSARHLLRWALLGALVFAVVVMHHSAPASTMHEPGAMDTVSVRADTHATADQPAPAHGSHDLLAHLCLAVLVVVGGLLLTAWFLGFAGHAVPPVRVAGWRPAVARGPPPRGGRQILNLACVIRV